MKKSSLLLITLFLNTLSLSPLFAGNTDVSGRWAIKAPYPNFNAQQITRTVSHTPKGDVVKIENSTVSVINFTFPSFIVTQADDGTISASEQISETTSTLTGKVTGNTLTFTITTTIPMTGIINGSTQFNLSCAGVITNNYMGDFLISRNVDFSYSGTYAASYSSYSPAVDVFVTRNANFGGNNSFLVVKVPFDTYITSGPAGTIADRNVTFNWIGVCNEGLAAGYYYQLDSQPQVFTTATSMTFNDLSYGQHAFSVAAVDSAGNVDPTPAQSAFTIQAGGAKPSRPQDSNFGEFNTDAQNAVGEPINSVTGNMYIITADLNMPGKGTNFTFTRTYNNQAASAGQTGPFGYGWTHSYNIYLTQDPENKLIKIKDGEGKGYLFADNQNGTYVSQRGEYSTLNKSGADFIWRKKDGSRYIFDADGRLTRIKDRNNNALTLTYSSQDQPITVTDSSGRQINISYAQGRIRSVEGPGERTFIYDYDGKGNLISVTDPLGKTTTYSYNSKHNLIRKTGADSRSMYYTYDSQNRCTSSSGENSSGRVDLVFDPAGKQTTITDSRGNATIHYYNDDSLITKVTNNQGKEVISSWDGNLNLLSRTDELGRVTTFEYDASGNLTKVIDPYNRTTLFAYEPNFNLLSSSTDALGNSTTYTRDSRGNPTKIIDALGNSTSYTYNSAGLPLSITDALGNTTTFTYDSQGNLTQVKDALVNITAFKYDSSGNLLESKDAKGNITKSVYNKLNQLVKVTYPDNTDVSYAYDAEGNRISSTDPKGNTTRYAYDQFGRLISSTDALGNSVNYTFDAEGNLLFLADQNNNTTTYAYDTLNRLILEEDALGNKKEFRYDAAGNRVKFTDPRGQITTYKYDKLNRLIKITYPDTSVSYTYDALGRRKGVTDAGGTTKYTYDKLSRLTKVDGPLAKDTISYTYDKLSNRISMADPDGKITQYSYDALSRLSKLTDPQGKAAGYTYDVLGNLASLTYPNQIRATYTYDSLGRLLKLTQRQTTGSKAKIAEITYTYDKTGRRARADLLDTSVITYGYDALGQLVSEHKTAPSAPYQISYAYDPAGNRTQLIRDGLKTDYSYNSLNQLTEEAAHTANSAKIKVTGRVTDAHGIKQVTVNGKKAALSGDKFTCANVTLKEGANTLKVVALDRAGNAAKKSIRVAFDPVEKTLYTYDDNGNLIRKEEPGKTYNLSYDALNRLKRFKGAGLDETYQYDGEGRRTGVKTGSTTTSYLYDGLNVILERSAAGTTTSRYIRNPNAPGGIGGVISRLSASNTPSYYHYDGLGSVTNLTNANGKSTQSYNYDAFGNSQGSASGNRRFLTKEADATGLIYYGARYYDPKIGRFISKDPLGFVDGPNVYSYVKNNPINSIDLYGLDTYYINNQFSTITPTNSPISHSFLAITDIDPITDKEIVVKTFSWVNTNGGSWENPLKEQNIKGAQRAIDTGVGSWKKGNDTLDPYIEAVFEKFKNEKGGYWPFDGNSFRGTCKNQADRLAKTAKKCRN